MKLFRKSVWLTLLAVIGFLAVFYGTLTFYIAVSDLAERIEERMHGPSTTTGFYNTLRAPSIWRSQHVNHR